MALSEPCLSSYVSSGFSGFDLIKTTSLLLITPIGALICLLILISSEINPINFQANKHNYAVTRLICAIAAAIPVIIIPVQVSNYNPMAQLTPTSTPDQGLAAMFGALVPLELNGGIWLNLIAIFVVGIEAFIDLRKE